MPFIISSERKAKCFWVILNYSVKLALTFVRIFRKSTLQNRYFPQKHSRQVIFVVESYE